MVLSTLILRHAGLVRPYDFERLLCVLAAGLLAIFVGAFALGCALTGELIRYTPREDYFIYLAALVVAGAVLARWPAIAAVPLALATIDLSLGMGSLALRETGHAFHSILPHNYNFDRRFKSHALLQARPIPSLSVEVTGNQVSHSSEATRGRDHDPAELARKSVIAVFGGSATYDIAVGDDDTWPNQLERQLGPANFAVINHGVPGYSTVEHLVQTAFYQDAFGVPPKCALYFIGWNDIRNAHIDGIDPGYARFHLRSQLDGLQVRPFGGSYRSTSPFATLIVRSVSNWLETVRPPRRISGEPKAGSDPVLEAFYLRNVRSISMINRGRGIRTIWVGQILNLAVLDDDEVYGWLPLVRNKDVWPLLSRFNKLLTGEALALGDVYVDARPDHFSSDDFRDNGHFLESGSLKLARLLAPIVEQACR